MLENVRIWFTKDGVARYISHLDLNRCMMRAMHRSHIPVWHTEGFNPHPFCTFALPLSLGFRGLRESMDIKLLKPWPEHTLVEAFNRSLPEGVQVFAATEPRMKPGEIASARFRILLTHATAAPEELVQKIINTLQLPALKAVKTSKGKSKEVDVKANLLEYHCTLCTGAAALDVLLPAGGSNNVNPLLLLEALEAQMQLPLVYDVTRMNLFNHDGIEFA